MNVASWFISHMEHALGKTPDARHVLLDTFNRAGRALVTANDWHWRTREGTVTAIAGQNYFELPNDFGIYRRAYIPAEDADSYRQIRAVSLEEIAALRERFESTSQWGVMSISFPDFTSDNQVDTTPTPQAPCFPTPAVNSDPTFNLIYTRRWRECTATTDTPNIPDDFEDCLRQGATLLAKQIEKPELDHSTLERLYQAELSRLIVEDARRQRSAGQRQGGALYRGRDMPQRHILQTPITF